MRVAVGNMFDWKGEEQKNMYIVADSREFTLVVEKTRDIKDKEGNVTGSETFYADPLHFSKLHNVINHLITMRVKESEKETVRELLVELKDIKRTVELYVLI